MRQMRKQQKTQNHQTSQIQQSSQVKNSNQQAQKIDSGATRYQMNSAVSNTPEEQQLNLSKTPQPINAVSSLSTKQLRPVPVVVFSNAVSSSGSPLKQTPFYQARKSLEPPQIQLSNLLSKDVKGNGRCGSREHTTQNSNHSDPHSAGSFAPPSKNRISQGAPVTSKSQKTVRRTRSKRLKSRSLIMVEVHTTDSDQGGDNSNRQRKPRNSRVVATIMTPQFKANREESQQHFHTQRESNTNNNGSLGPSQQTFNEYASLMMNKQNMGSKSAKHLNNSSHSSQFSPNQAQNQGGSAFGGGTPLDNFKASFATESCIKANRTAVREQRPPFNDGDDSNKSSFHSEPELATLDERNAGEVGTDEPQQVLFMESELINLSPHRLRTSTQQSSPNQHIPVIADSRLSNNVYIENYINQSDEQIQFEDRRQSGSRRVGAESEGILEDDESQHFINDQKRQEIVESVLSINDKHSKTDRGTLRFSDQLILPASPVLNINQSPQYHQQSPPRRSIINLQLDTPSIIEQKQSQSTKNLDNLEMSKKGASGLLLNASQDKDSVIINTNQRSEMIKYKDTGSHHKRRQSSLSTTSQKNLQRKFTNSKMDSRDERNGSFVIGSRYTIGGVDEIILMSSTDPALILSQSQQKASPTRSINSNSCKRCIMCQKDLGDGDIASSHDHQQFTPNRDLSPIKQSPKPLQMSNLPMPTFQSSRNLNNTSSNINTILSTSGGISPSEFVVNDGKFKRNSAQILGKSNTTQNNKSFVRNSVVNQTKTRGVKAPVITLNLGGGGSAPAGKIRTPERHSIPFSMASQSATEKPSLMASSVKDNESSAKRLSSPKILFQQSDNPSKKNSKSSPIPSPRTSPYRTVHHNISYSHHQFTNQPATPVLQANQSDSSPRHGGGSSPQNQTSTSNSQTNNNNLNGATGGVGNSVALDASNNFHSETRRRTTNSTSPNRISHLPGISSDNIMGRSQGGGLPSSPGGAQTVIQNNSICNHQLQNSLTEGSQDGGAASSSVMINTNLESLIKYIAQQHQQQQQAILPTSSTPNPTLMNGLNLYSSLDSATLPALLQGTMTTSGTAVPSDHQQTALILQRQELLIEKAVSEYNKLLTRYNDLLQKQSADRQLMHSQALLLQSKDDAMRALNSRVVELEQKVQAQAKEIGMVKNKAAEDKEQAFAEAHAHEKAKQQMAQVVNQMQDSEKDLKHKLTQAIQVQNEQDQAIKQYKEQLLRLETEKKCLEIDIQRRYRIHGDNPSSDELVRALRQENQDLRFRIDDNLITQGIKVPSSLMPNTFATLGAGPYTNQTQFGVRKDSLVSNSAIGGFQNQLNQQSMMNQMMPPVPEDYLSQIRSPARRTDGMMTESQAMSIPVEKYFAQQKHHEQHVNNPSYQLPGHHRSGNIAGTNKGRPEIPILNLRQINLNLDNNYADNNNSGRAAGSYVTGVGTGIFRSPQAITNTINSNNFYNTTPAALQGLSGSLGPLGNTQYGAIGAAQVSTRTNHHRMQSPIAFDRKLQQNDSTSMSGVLHWPANQGQNNLNYQPQSNQSSNSKIRSKNRSSNYISDVNELPPAGIPSYITSLNQNKMVFNVYNTTI